MASPTTKGPPGVELVSDVLAPLAARCRDRGGGAADASAATPLPARLLRGGAAAARAHPYPRPSRKANAPPRGERRSPPESAAVKTLATIDTAALLDATIFPVLQRGAREWDFLLNLKKSLLRALNACPSLCSDPRPDAHLIPLWQPVFDLCCRGVSDTLSLRGSLEDMTICYGALSLSAFLLGSLFGEDVERGLAAVSDVYLMLSRDAAVERRLSKIFDLRHSTCLEDANVASLSYFLRMAQALHGTDHCGLGAGSQLHENNALLHYRLSAFFHPRLVECVARERPGRPEAKGYAARFSLNVAQALNRVTLRKHGGATALAVFPSRSGAVYGFCGGCGVLTVVQCNNAPTRQGPHLRFSHNEVVSLSDSLGHHAAVSTVASQVDPMTLRKRFVTRSTEYAADLPGTPNLGSDCGSVLGSNDRRHDRSAVVTVAVMPVAEAGVGSCGAGGSSESCEAIWAFTFQKNRRVVASFLSSQRGVGRQVREVHKGLHEDCPLVRPFADLLAVHHRFLTLFAAVSDCCIVEFDPESDFRPTGKVRTLHPALSLCVSDANLIVSVEGGVQVFDIKTLAPVHEEFFDRPTRSLLFGKDKTPGGAPACSQAKHHPHIALLRGSHDARDFSRSLVTADSGDGRKIAFYESFFEDERRRQGTAGGAAPSRDPCLLYSDAWGGILGGTGQPEHCLLPSEQKLYRRDMKALRAAAIPTSVRASLNLVPEQPQHHRIAALPGCAGFASLCGSFVSHWGPGLAADATTSRKAGESEAFLRAYNYAVSAGLVLRTDLRTGKTLREHRLLHSGEEADALISKEVEVLLLSGEWQKTPPTTRHSRFYYECPSTGEVCWDLRARILESDSAELRSITCPAGSPLQAESSLGLLEKTCDAIDREFRRLLATGVWVRRACKVDSLSGALCGEAGRSGLPQQGAMPFGTALHSSGRRCYYNHSTTVFAEDLAGHLRQVVVASVSSACEGCIDAGIAEHRRQQQDTQKQKQSQPHHPRGTPGQSGEEPPAEHPLNAPFCSNALPCLQKGGGDAACVGEEEEEEEVVERDGVRCPPSKGVGCAPRGEGEGRGGPSCSGYPARRARCRTGRGSCVVMRSAPYIWRHKNIGLYRRFRRMARQLGAAGPAGEEEQAWGRSGGGGGGGTPSPSSPPQHPAPSCLGGSSTTNDTASTDGLSEASSVRRGSVFPHILPQEVDREVRQLLASGEWVLDVAAVPPVYRHRASDKTLGSVESLRDHIRTSRSHRFQCAKARGYRGGAMLAAAAGDTATATPWGDGLDEAWADTLSPQWASSTRGSAYGYLTAPFAGGVPASMAHPGAGAAAAAAAAEEEEEEAAFRRRVGKTMQLWAHLGYPGTPGEAAAASIAVHAAAGSDQLAWEHIKAGELAPEEADRCCYKEYGVAGYDPMGSGTFSSAQLPASALAEPLFKPRTLLLHAGSVAVGAAGGTGSVHKQQGLNHHPGEPRLDHAGEGAKAQSGAGAGPEGEGESLLATCICAAPQGVYVALHALSTACTSIVHVPLPLFEKLSDRSSASGALLEEDRVPAVLEAADRSAFCLGCVVAMVPCAEGVLAATTEGTVQFVTLGLVRV